MIPLFRLIRLPNLIIIALTMYGVRHWLIEPMWIKANAELLIAGYEFAGIRLQLTGIHFGLLVFSTLLIAAAGYIINDYFDTKADRINRPERVVVGRSISRRQAMFLHWFLSSGGLLIGIYLAYTAGKVQLASIQLFSILSLWFYSTHLKKQLLAGNILIAFLAALVPVTVGVYEFISGSLSKIEIINLVIPYRGTAMLQTTAYLVTGFALFAFLSNLIREIVKDIQDVQGDYSDGRRTLPVIIGEPGARYISLGLVLFTMLLLAMVQQYLFKSQYYLVFGYTLLCVQLPFLLLLLKLWKSREAEDYAKASLYCKLIIVSGVVSMLMFRLTPAV